jgi:hypothetical protein
VALFVPALAGFALSADAFGVQVYNTEDVSECRRDGLAYCVEVRVRIHGSLQRPDLGVE